MRAPTRAFLVIAAIAPALTGCGTRRIVEAAPPCATILVVGQSEADIYSLGQGVWVSNRVLTAAHVLTDREGDFPPRSLWLNGDPTPVLSYRTGDLDKVRRAYTRGEQANPSELVEDWAGFEVPLDAPTGKRMRIGNGSVRPGEVLYAVGFDPETNGGELLTLPLIVFKAVVDTGASTQPLPDRIIPVRSSGRGILRGWSGAFVGRYDTERREWEYVGQLIMGFDRHKGRIEDHAVLRPPDEALEWLMQGKPRALGE